MMFQVIGTTAWNSGSLLPRYLYMGELDIRGVAIGVQDDFTEEFLQMHHFITQGQTQTMSRSQGPFPRVWSWGHN